MLKSFVQPIWSEVADSLRRNANIGRSINGSYPYLSRCSVQKNPKEVVCEYVPLRWDLSLYQFVH